MQGLQGMWVWSLGWEDPLGEEMAPHSIILAWRIPWTEEPGGLQSMRLQRVRYYRAQRGNGYISTCLEHMQSHTENWKNHVCVCVCVCVFESANELADLSVGMFSLRGLVGGLRVYKERTAGSRRQTCMAQGRFVVIMIYWSANQKLYR